MAQNSVEIIEIFQVIPSIQSSLSPNHDHQHSLPLTFFDIRLLRLPTSERLFFYKIPNAKPNTTTFFFDEILPRLKHSLSLTLRRHFLPLSGRVTWPPGSPKPVLDYNAVQDGVLLTVAKSGADFNQLSSFNDVPFCEASAFRPFVPSLPASHDQAAVLAFQVTLFPDYCGFSLGSAMNHTVVDGKSFTNFLRSWAHISRLLGGNHRLVNQGLPPELKPSYEYRTLIKDPANLAEIYSNHWLNFDGTENRSVMHLERQVSPDLFRGTFHLPQAKIEQLRQSATLIDGRNEPVRVSTFSLVSAFTLLHLVKAQEITEDRIVFFFVVDCRSRLKPPLPATYFGNCAVQTFTTIGREALLGKEGFSVAANAINQATRSLDIDKLFDGAENWVSGLISRLKHTASSLKPGVYRIVSSPRFEVYDTDFGWGRPIKVEMVSSDVLPGGICLSDNRDGDGIEIGLVLNKRHMEAFASLFAQSLEVN